MRDGECDTVTVRSDLVLPKQYTGKYKLCLLADRTVRRVPVARVSVVSPFYVGVVDALVMNTPLFDVIIGNIEGARDLVGKHHDTRASVRTTTAQTSRKDNG